MRNQHLTPFPSPALMALTPAATLLSDEAFAASIGAACPNLSGVFLWLVLGMLGIILLAFSGFIHLVSQLPRQTRSALRSPYTVAASGLIMQATLLAPLCFTV